MADHPIQVTTSPSEIFELYMVPEPVFRCGEQSMGDSPALEIGMHRQPVDVAPPAVKTRDYRTRHRATVPAGTASTWPSRPWAIL